MSCSLQTSNTEASSMHELKANLLEQQKANAMLLHDKETAILERDLLREEVLRLFRDGNQDNSITSDTPPPPSLPPPPIPTFPTSIPSNEDTGECAVYNLLEKLRLADGGERIREEGTKLVKHLREKAIKQKRAMLQAKDERECAVVKLRSTEINLKAKESRFMKEIEDLSEENIDISEQFEEMKLVYSLKKGMSREDEIQNEYEKQLDSMEKAMEERHDQNQVLLVALNKAQSERNMMLEKYQKLEDRYKRERGYTPLSRNSSLSQAAPVTMREVLSHARSSSISSQTSQRSLPSTSN